MSGAPALRVLFLCTGNSARSQMAEALLNWKGRGRFQGASAGSRPAAGVHPRALAALREHGVAWAGHPPRGVAGLEREPWDAVITLCDQAREACPVFPGRPPFAHWDIPDPAAVEGDEAMQQAAFRDALRVISHRIEELLAHPPARLAPKQGSS